MSASAASQQTQRRKQVRKTNSERLVMHRERNEADMRKRLHSFGLIGYIHQSALAIEKIVSEAWTDQTDENGVVTRVHIGLTEEQARTVNAIHKSADIRLRMLNKVLPDLKSVETEKPRDTLDPTETAAELERVLKLAGLRLESQHTVEGEFTEATG